jgi:hypothetical protein
MRNPHSTSSLPSVKKASSITVNIIPVILVKFLFLVGLKNDALERGLEALTQDKATRIQNILDNDSDAKIWDEMQDDVYKDMVIAWPSRFFYGYTYEEREGFEKQLPKNAEPIPSGSGTGKTPTLQDPKLGTSMTSTASETEEPTASTGTKYLIVQ